MSESNIRKLLRTLVEPVQDLEDAAVTARGGLSISGEGFVLDVIGRIVGQARDGRLDAAYRKILRGAIQANRSSGTPEDALLRVARAVLADDTGVTVRIEDTGIAALYVHLESAAVSADTAADVTLLLQRARLAGVRLLVHYLTAAPDATFSFTRSAHAAGALTAGQTTITVDSTAGFPAGGVLSFEIGTTVEESHTYTITSATTFLITTALTHNHDARAAVTVNDTDRAFADGVFSALLD